MIEPGTPADWEQAITDRLNRDEKLVALTPTFTQLPFDAGYAISGMIGLTETRLLHATDDPTYNFAIPLHQLWYLNTLMLEDDGEQYGHITLTDTATNRTRLVLAYQHITDLLAATAALEMAPMDTEVDQFDARALLLEEVDELTLKLKKVGRSRGWWALTAVLALASAGVLIADKINPDLLPFL